MLFFMVDKDHFIMTNAPEETVKEFWNNYRSFRYDMNFSFCDFLRENGIYVRDALPSFGPLGYDLASIEVSLN